MRETFITVALVSIYVWMNSDVWISLVYVSVRMMTERMLQERKKNQEHRLAESWILQQI